MRFNRRRYRSRRKRKVVRKLTAASINRALTTVRSWRGQTLTSIVTGANNADFPVVIRPGGSNSTYTTGFHIFGGFNATGGGIRLNTIIAEALPAAANPATFVDDSSGVIQNPVKVYGNWVKGQIRNTSLNPTVVEIFDVICIQDLATDLAGYANNTTNYMMETLYQGWQTQVNAVDLLATVRDTAEAAFASANAAAWAMACTNDFLPIGTSPLFREYFKIVRKHKVLLAPGQSYIWKVKGFKPYTYVQSADSLNKCSKGQTYIPLIRARGDLGNSSATVGYTALQLMCKWDYGCKMYNVNRGYTRVIGTGLAEMPISGTAITGPSEDVAAA